MDEGATPRPALRLKHLLHVLERHPEQRGRVVALLARLWREADVAALFADFGFTSRRDLGGELAERLRLRVLPATPDTDDLGVLFQLMFTHNGDAGWIAAIDPPTLARLADLMGEARTQGRSAGPAGRAAGPEEDWRAPLLRAMTWLVSAIRAAGFDPMLRQRMAASLVANRPFDQLVRASDDVANAVLAAAPEARQVAQQVNFLRALLQQCRSAADSVHEHLEQHGISVDIVFEVQQLQDRINRLEALLNVLVAPAPAAELQHLVVELVGLSRERRSVRALLAQQYSLLARKVAERHAETGVHYITRNLAEYKDMLARAAGGGVVIAGTTFAKFGLMALGLAPFWGGFAAGMNYALSFLLIHLLHWTVATKQPAMTAPALADRLSKVRAVVGGDKHAAVEEFVDEITHLVRSQVAGIAGNLALVVPVVLLVQGLAWWLQGAPLVSEQDARYVLHSITLLGPTALFAAFTGVLLFASSLVAGWAENWFVYHRLDSALAHHPWTVGRLGPARAAYWADWWRRNISGVAANLSLGMMLGLVPVLLAFVGLGLEVRHVTLATGQLAAAVSTLGLATLQSADFWWCVAGIGVIGVLNLSVSFFLALKVALRSRNINAPDRQELRGALWRRLRQAPRSFLLPPRPAAASAAAA